LLIVLALSFFSPFAGWFLLGIMLHYALDLHHIIKDLHIGVRRYSIIRSWRHGTDVGK
jgi:hypothetical protein